MKAIVAGIGFVVSTFLILIIFDLKQLVVTPLTLYGINHWIPEFLALLFIGYYITDKLGKFMTKTIIGCVMLYVVLTYFLMSQPFQFSIGSGSFFVVAMLVGMLLKLKRGIKNE